MSFAHVGLVIGTRPEAIKLSPVARALAARGIDCTLVVTGQHAGLEPSDYRLGDFAAVRLNCPGRLSPYAHAASVELAMRALLREPPMLLLVQGDTSSAFAAASAAFAAGVPVAHVEAGLRTYDPRSPWPEEEFRAAIDARAALLFAPTATAAANLAAERISGEVHVTGNSGIDALFEVLERLPRHAPDKGAGRRLLVTCHRRESWGEGVDEIATAMAGLAGRGDCSIDLVLHPNPLVAEPLRRRLDGLPAVTLLPPLPHDHLITRMRAATLILSDSGGIQEEAPALGVPLLVMRAKTERPEGLASGNSLLVGVSAAQILTEANRLLDDPERLAAMARPSLPFGDGTAACNIADAVERWIAGRRRRAERRA